MVKIPELAYTRADIRQDCTRKGKKFIIHFDKIYQDYFKHYFDDMNHHCVEMQAWWDDVKSLRYKHNKQYIKDTDLYDWFFTAGAISDDFLKSKEEVEFYEKVFIPELLLNRTRPIRDIIAEIFEIQF